jgi:membrane protein DedA with SNARE-associated domain
LFIDQFFAWLQAIDAWLEGLMWLLISWVHALGPLGVFIGVMIETFIAPIPSPLVPMAAGAILTIGLNPVEALLVILFSVMFVGALAATLGSFFAYGIAYFGGYPIIERYGKYLGTSIEEIEYTRQSLEKSSRDEIYLFTARAVPIVPLSVVSLLYGAIRADPKRYTLFTFLGCLPRYLVLGLSGWLLGLVLLNVIDFFETVILAFILIFFVGFVLYRIVIRRRSQKMQNVLKKDEPETDEESSLESGDHRQRRAVTRRKTSPYSPDFGDQLGGPQLDP